MYGPFYSLNSYSVASLPFPPSARGWEVEAAKLVSGAEELAMLLRARGKITLSRFLSSKERSILVVYSASAQTWRQNPLHTSVS